MLIWLPACLNSTCSPKFQQQVIWIPRPLLHREASSPGSWLVWLTVFFTELPIRTQMYNTLSAGWRDASYKARLHHHKQLRWLDQDSECAEQRLWHPTMTGKQRADNLKTETNEMHSVCQQCTHLLRFFLCVCVCVMRDTDRWAEKSRVSEGQWVIDRCALPSVSPRARSDL